MTRLGYGTQLRLRAACLGSDHLHRAANMRTTVTHAAMSVGVLLAGATVGMIVAAPAAFGAPSDQASCVAQFVHSPGRAARTVPA